MRAKDEKLGRYKFLGVEFWEIINSLYGHVEKDVSVFTIESTAERKTIFKVHTFSQPGTFLTELVGRFFSVPYRHFAHGKEF